MRDKSVRTIEIKAESPAYGGICIGRLSGRIVMIKGAIPGETVRARIDIEKKDYLTATTVGVIDPSPDRVVPKSPYYGRCGGCQLQHVSYARQVGIKEEVLRAALRRIAGIGVELAPSLTGEPFGYRLRGQFKVSRGRLGFYRERSREVVDVEHCALMGGPVDAYYGKARALVTGGLKDAGITGLHISCGEEGAIALIRLVRGAVPDMKAMAREFMGAGFSGVVVEAANGRPRIFGTEHITLDLDGLKYTVSAQSFFQGNWPLNQAVVRLVVEMLQPLKGKRVLDIYAGAGNFSLPIAREALHVTAIEENPHAVGDGEANLSANGIDNVRFVRYSAGSFEMEGPVDIVVADPPRTGLDKGVAEKIIALSPEKILYVSCDPATLARDLKTLSAKYAIKSGRMVDFFPQTYHIESVTLLSKLP